MYCAAASLASRARQAGCSARQMLRGVEELADAVKVTMGPKGRTVIIEQSFGAPKVTKDGVTVAKSIEFSDRVKNVGASLVKQVANATNDTAGDGTTCATVLTKAIFTEGCKSVAAGMNAMDLRRGIVMAVDAVDGNTLYNELEVLEGMKLDRGYISPYFITNQKNQKCELNEPLILIHNKKISNVQAMIKVMELALQKQKPLLIVAEDLQSEALGTLILNKLRAGVKVCAVKAPGFGDTKKANLQDLAILTGAEVITEELGMNLENFEPQMFGTCKKVTISKDDTIILDGAGDKKAIEERAEQAPVQTIASNAGVEGAVIAGKLLEQENTDLGYDAGEYVDMLKAGIIDPLKVIRTALMDAASVSSLMATTESIIVETPKEESNAPAMEY
ncbi:Heat shock protein 60 isoform 3 [Panicum miliaceum]|uniref:Heat shock protein 60 isoform 3 n=1 Tax=Panicum miliaceum TaxID=4540 RepID=A0A3L6S588_PANMI|nr:Heat shock protein 60 isoform 3 [Panicum miliaceum]